MGEGLKRAFAAAKKTRTTQNAYKQAFTDRLRELMTDYESLLGAEAIVSAIREALVQERFRNQDIGIYTRAARYEDAAKRLENT